MVNVAYNWTMLGTDGTVRKCFKQDNIENGLSSRVLVAEMPDGSFSRLVKFKKRSKADEERIQQAVKLLRSANGIINVPRLRKAIENWLEEKRIEAAKDIDRVKDTYRRRAAVIGFRCGVVYHILTGKTHETSGCLKFAQIIAQYCLDQQLKLFGEALRNQYIKAQDEGQRQSTNHTVFDQLAPVFSRDDLRAQKQGCSSSCIRTILMRWKNDGWIQAIDNQHWQKCVATSHVTASH